MDKKKTYEWLSERGIMLEESFAQALRKLAVVYQRKNNISRINDVYKLIGIRKQLVLHWAQNPSSVQTKKF